MSSNKPLVSVIIPTYNVEPYLIKCLDSVEAQSYNNFECIIIVDGATDRSYEIAKEYAESHPRFKVFLQENAGSGPARNNGIAHSKGEFICFIDPDDWVEDNYIETLVTEQRKGDYDLVISQSVDVKITKDNTVAGINKHNKPIFSYQGILECREKFPYIMFDLHYLDGPINKLFKRPTIVDNNVTFPSYRRSQDMVFNFRYYNYIGSISTIPDYTYNIRVEYPPRPGRGRVFEGYNEIVKKIYVELKKQLDAWKLNKNYETELSTWSFWYLYACVKGKITSNDANDYYQFVKKEPYKSIIKKARPKLISQKIVRLFLITKSYFVINQFIKFIEKLK